jgi:hypothetical protein
MLLDRPLRPEVPIYAEYPAKSQFHSNSIFRRLRIKTGRLEVPASPIFPLKYGQSARKMTDVPKHLIIPQVAVR